MAVRKLSNDSTVQPQPYRIGFGRPKPPVEALPVSVDGCPSKALNETIEELKGLFPLIG